MQGFIKWFGFWFWGFFAFSLIVHFLIGGVVLDHRYDEGIYWLLLRDAPDVWQQVSGVRYYLHQTSSWGALLTCGVGLIYVVLRWCRANMWPEQDGDK